MIKQSRTQSFFANFRSSLRTWITAYILLIALIPAFAVSVSSFLIAQRNLNNQEARSIAQEFERISITTEAFLAQFPQDLVILRDSFSTQAIFRSLENGGIDPASQDTYTTWVGRLTLTFANTAENLPGYQQIRLLDAEGNEIVRTDFYEGQVVIPWDEELINSADTDYFQAAKALSPGEIYISSIELNKDYADFEPLNVPVMRYSTPIFNNSQEFQGVLTTSVYASAIIERLQTNDQSQQSPNRSYILADTNGNYLYNLNNAGSVTFLENSAQNIFEDLPNLSEKINLLDDTATNSEFTIQNSNDQMPNGQSAKSIFYLESRTGNLVNEYVSLQQIYFDSGNTERHFQLLHTVPQNEIQGLSILARLVPYLLFGILVAVIAVLSGLSLARNISKPIVAVSQAATNLAQVSKDRNMHRLPQTLLEVDRKDELGDLEISFNQMTETLSSTYVDLEQRIEQQRHVLNMLTISGQVSEKVTTILDKNELLGTALSMLKEQFNLYHVAILLLDEEGTKLSFAFGSDKQSRQLIESRESIALDHPNSLVARAAQQKQVILVNDVSLEPQFLPHPLITETKSELSIPLMVHGQFIGVLDIQEDEVNRFDDADSSLFVSIGRQLAIAIHNAQLFEKFQQSREQLTVALDKAVQSDKAKDEFIARVSHELRTPLGAILGNAEMIQDEMYGDINSEQSERLDDIIDSSSHLTTLVNQLLDSSKLDSGKIDPNYQKFNLYELTYVVQKQMKPLAKQKELDLILRYDEQLPNEVTSDPLLIRQMIINLVGNAIKFTDVGEISINLSRNDQKSFALTVTDSGIGIPAKDQNTIFEPFRQVDGSKTRTRGGTGLGLSITKRMVEILGGTIELISTEGVGSQFIIILPLKKGGSSSLKPIKRQSGILPEFEKSTELEPISISEKHSLN